MAASIEVSEEKGVRYLHFGSHWIQGAMRLARPWALELEYTRDMMVALLLRSTAPWPKSVLVIGLGAGSVAKFLYRHRPRAILTVVEIEPAVVNAASQFFKLPDDARRLAIEIGDGNDFVAATRRHFDLIMVDGYDAKCRAGMLETLQRGFVTYQRAMGIPPGLIVCKYVLRNSLISTVTQIGLLFGILLAGAVVVETVFQWPGIGAYAFEAILHSDYAAVMGFTVYAGVVFGLVNLLVDVLHALLDPREGAA